VTAGDPPFLPLDRFLEEETGRAFPGAVVALVAAQGTIHLRAFGGLTFDPAAPRVGPDTVFDLASLTKVVATTTLAMTLVDEGLDLQESVGSILPGLWENVRLWDLLAHSSGLPAHRPLFHTLQGREAYLEATRGLPLEFAPGTASVYSDLGFIVLGAALEARCGAGLEGLVRTRVTGPLGMDETVYRPPREWSARIAPTEVDPWRGRLLVGEVHDENAQAMGGVSAHAGLFGTARDLSRFAAMLVGGGSLEGRRIVSPETLALFRTRVGIPGSSRALGWDTPAPGSSAGERLGASSFGHTGFTGTSIWVDPERRLAVILLSNRVHPSRENTRIVEVRKRVADLAVDAFGASGAR
jgi:CubicO group peptidase (beta-lactamase class C family)